jgi:hypothetical protein
MKATTWVESLVRWYLPHRYLPMRETSFRDKLKAYKSVSWRTSSGHSGTTLNFKNRTLKKERNMNTILNSFHIATCGQRRPHGSATRLSAKIPIEIVRHDDDKAYEILIKQLPARAPLPEDGSPNSDDIGTPGGLTAPPSINRRGTNNHEREMTSRAKAWPAACRVASLPGRQFNIVTFNSARHHGRKRAHTGC